jgi:hypothetical protein
MCTVVGLHPISRATRQARDTNRSSAYRSRYRNRSRNLTISVNIWQVLPSAPRLRLCSSDPLFRHLATPAVTYPHDLDTELKSVQCRFESDWGHHICTGRCVFRFTGNPFGPVPVSHALLGDAQVLRWQCAVILPVILVITFVGGLLRRVDVRPPQTGDLATPLRVQRPASTGAGPGTRDRES